MAKGDGGIKQRERGVYDVQVYCGKDAAGKYRRVTKRVRGTLADARKVRDELRREYESGVKIDARNMTLSEFIPIWADAKRLAGTARETTIEGYLHMLRHVEKHLGNVPLCKVDAQAIERTYLAIKQERGIGNTTLHSIHVSLKDVLHKACDYDYIMRNPCDKVNAPKVDESTRNALEAREAARLLVCLNDAEGAAYAAMAEKEARQVAWGVDDGRSFVYGVLDISRIMAVRVILATGMRKGEALALTWGNVHGAQISVKQSLTDRGELKPPKTKKGDRPITIDAETVTHLRTWKVKQAEYLALFDMEQTKDTPVFCSNVGGFINPQNMQHWWKKFRAAQGFAGLKLHELRHTQATLLLANGVDVKTVQTRLGHADASITLNCYAHAVAGNDARAAAIFGNLCNNKTARIIELDTA